MGGSPCGGPKRSAPGKKSEGCAFGRNVASSLAALATCAHNVAQNEMPTARTKAVARCLKAMKEHRAMGPSKRNGVLVTAMRIPSSLERDAGAAADILRIQR